MFGHGIDPTEAMPIVISFGITGKRFANKMGREKLSSDHGIPPMVQMENSFEFRRRREIQEIGNHACVNSKSVKRHTFPLLWV
jgi:hypothetical protein